MTNFMVYIVTRVVIVRAQNLFIRGSKDNTQLEARLTSAMLRDKYIKELHVISSRK